ncbi:MAG TPA: hypothetical protein DEF82_05090 [Crocinitomicaceae bacterium]|nr:hypothetical protein [Flavobacteriales bacterium]HBW86119.1 hypothetical protein [Crocinitomicaceae bacterium]
MRIKKTMSCKAIEYNCISDSFNKSYLPKIGDVALFEVLEIGKHKTVQLSNKRNATILQGDKILGSFANRYATAQFEGYLPDQPTEILDILGAGGAIGIVKSKNAAFHDIEPTKLKLLGFALDDNQQIINTIYNQTQRKVFRGEVPNQAKVILSLGSTMDSGKTTSAAYLARGIKNNNKKVAFIKLTGTCYSKDKDLVYDCGADISIDFMDAGFPSTFLINLSDLKDLYQTLLDQLIPHNPDYIVMEIADGLVQKETEELIRDGDFMKTVSDIVLSCGDSLAVFWGVDFLNKLGKKPTVIAGRFTMSPLLIDEVSKRVPIPVKTLEGLMDKSIIQLFS